MESPLVVSLAIASSKKPHRASSASGRTARLLPWLVLLYCAWQAVDLWTAWTSHSPEAWGWLIFAIWSLPAIRGLAMAEGRDRPQVSLLTAAVLLAFLGQLTWLNCLQHVALALAIVAWRQPLRWQRGWLAVSFLWMPAFGWLVEGSLAGWETPLRIGVTGLFVVAMTVAPRCQRLAVFGLLAFSPMATLQAETFTYSPVQSPARPFGLDIVDQVGLAGSDSASADFLNNTLPTMQQLIDENLRETVAVNDPSQTDGLIALDPNALTLSVAADVRVYFVGEGAGYHNSLGFNTGGGGIDTGDPLLIFPDASSPNSYLSSGSGTRTTSQPLFPGDFVELGSMDAGTHLDFSLIANGANGGTNLFSTDTALNPDGIDHVVAFAQVDNPYLLIGFEDLLGGGDEDYNDLLFAVYFGEQNVQELIDSSPMHGVPAPEPGFIWLIVLACGGWIYRARRRRSKKLPSGR